MVGSTNVLISDLFFAYFFMFCPFYPHTLHFFFFIPVQRGGRDSSLAAAKCVYCIWPWPGDTLEITVLCSAATARFISNAMSVKVTPVLSERLQTTSKLQVSSIKTAGCLVQQARLWWQSEFNTCQNMSNSENIFITVTTYVLVI